jgi:hypothetical protein
MEKLIENYLELRALAEKARAAIPRDCPFYEMAPDKYDAWDRAYRGMCEAARGIAEHVVEGKG